LVRTPPTVSFYPPRPSVFVNSPACYPSPPNLMHGRRTGPPSPPPLSPSFPCGCFFCFSPPQWFFWIFCPPGLAPNDFFQATNVTPPNGPRPFPNTHKVFQHWGDFAEPCPPPRPGKRFFSSTSLFFVLHKNNTLSFFGSDTTPFGYVRGTSAPPRR